MYHLTRFLNLKCSRFGTLSRQFISYKTKKYKRVDEIKSDEYTDQLIKKFAPKLIYNTIVDQKIRRLDFPKIKTKSRVKETDPIPISLKYLNAGIEVKETEIPNEFEEKYCDNKLVNFPYSNGYELKPIIESAAKDEDQNVILDMASEASEEVRKRYELQKEMKNWMVSYDNYNDDCLEEENDINIDDWRINYGTPDPSTEISNVPCGGCGALLHCKDTAIPGYIPSEIFKNSFVEGGVNLEATICQRCHFLKNFNLALQVQVTPENYPKVLQTISQRKGLVVLMVDLLDFPCSIWPGIGEIFGSHTPIVIVGNKIDLLPQDSKRFLKHIRKVLLDNIKLQGFATFNIKDVALISAKTGYGIEDLLTKLNSLNRIKGDVYIVGCTNVGKSSLFNAFLQSDYCKTQAIDLIQRATTSVWPGTTLNLLKFPIKRPAGYRQFLRNKRLEIMQKIEVEEHKFRREKLKKTKDPKYASLIGYIDITKNPNDREADKIRDIFTAPNKTKGMLMGINEKAKEFLYSKWCFDTPGVVQPDQIIHLLTTEELLLTLPKELILPRTFCIKPNTSLFIAGLARLDYVNGLGSVKFTVFTSNELPITVCAIDDAEELYNELLGSDLLRVPTGNVERLSKWPKLGMAKEFTITGENWYQSVNDVVLSNAGWIAVTGKEALQYSFKAWTPEKRGVYLRDCLLPYAVALTGRRRSDSVAYNRQKFYLG